MIIMKKSGSIAKLIAYARRISIATIEINRNVDFHLFLEIWSWNEIRCDILG